MYEENMVTSDNRYIIGYHTQERRGLELKAPIMCCRNDAWLGDAYYFWDDIYYAHKWGIDSKGNNYQIYRANINADHILDTEYNREGRAFFYACIDKIKKICSKKSLKYETKVLNRLLKEMFWDKMDITGIIVGDTPQDESSRNTAYIFHKRRVQIAVFDENIIKNFQPYNY